MRGAWLCTIVVATACTSYAPGVAETRQSSPALTATPTSGQLTQSQAPLVVPTPLTEPTVQVSELPAVAAYQLAKVPDGYSPPVEASYSIPSTRIFQYLPNPMTSEANGERISVLATSDKLSSLYDHYDVLGKRSVRGGKLATFFRVQETAHPRQALAWVEGPRLVLAVYGRKTGSDLVVIANQVVRR